MSVLGFGKSAEVEVANARITPKRVVMGEKVNIAFDVSNTSGHQRRFAEGWLALTRCSSLLI